MIVGKTKGKKGELVVAPTVFKKGKQKHWVGGNAVHKTAVRALEHHGKEFDPLTTALHQSIQTGEDLFHAALLWSSFDRHIIYPLPLIRQPDLASTSASSFQPGDGTSAPMTNTKWWRQNGPTEVLKPSFNANNTFRYSVFHGLLQSTLRMSVPGGGNKVIWIGLDPLCESCPVVALDMSDPTNPKSVGSLNLSYSGWTNSPNVLPTDFQTVVSEKPPDPKKKEPTCHHRNARDYRGCDCVEVVPDHPFGGPPLVKNNYQKDTDNLYWPGGAQLALDWINPNLYGAAAMRVRTNRNVNHRVLDNLQFVQGTATTKEPLFTVPLRHCKSARAGYSGDQWDVLKNYTDVFTDGEERDFATYAQIDHILRTGKPFIEVNLSSTSATTSNFMFSLTAECWNGASSCDDRLAGSMPYETIPFDIPTWWVAARSSGELGAASTSGLQMGFDSMGGITQLMGSQTPFTRLASQSTGRATAQKLLGATVSAVGASPLNHSVVGEALQTIGGAHLASKLPGMARSVRGLPSRVLKIPSAGRTLMKNIVNKAPGKSNFFSRTFGNLESELSEGFEKELAEVGPTLAEDAAFLI